MSIWSAFHALIAAAINRVTTATNNERRSTSMPLCIANLRSSVSSSPNFSYFLYIQESWINSVRRQSVTFFQYFSGGTVLPSYEEAVSMSCSDNVPINSQRWDHLHRAFSVWVLEKLLKLLEILANWLQRTRETLCHPSETIKMKQGFSHVLTA